MPTPSTPTMIGRVRLAKAMPRKPNRSMWLSDTIFMRTSTSSPVGGAGSATSSIDIAPPSWCSRSAFIGPSPLDAEAGAERAVDRDLGPVHVGRAVRHQEADDRRQVLGLGVALRRDLLLQHLAERGVGRQHVGVDIAGRQIVDRDAAPRDLSRQRLAIAEQR